MKVVRQISYTIQFRSSLLKMWKATLQACIRPAAFLSAVLTAIFTPIVASLLLFHWNIVVLFVLMFVSITSAFALIFSLAGLLQAGSTLCVVKLGPEGCSSQIGRVSSETRWPDVKCVLEGSENILIEFKAGGGIKVPD